jgi:hypothetical protein
VDFRGCKSRTIREAAARAAPRAVERLRRYNGPLCGFIRIRSVLHEIRSLLVVMRFSSMRRQLLACLLAVSTWAAARAEIRVDTDFEGGSAKILEIDDASKRIRVMPAGDPAHGWPCWWYLRVSGLAAEDVLTLEVKPSDAQLLRPGKHFGKPLPAAWSQPDRATYSTDGTTWKQTEEGQRHDDVIRYRITAAGDCVWLAWGPPFTPSDAKKLVEELGRLGDWVEAFELARSRGGRPCPALRIAEGDRPRGERPAIWLQARQHAWESGSSWVCRGFAEWLASDDPRAKSLRHKAEIVIVPVMDIDNTAAGNGGKESLPQDHNRDWTDQPHHPEVAAAQRHLKDLSDSGRLVLFVDLHNPGPTNKQPYFYVCPDETLEEIGRQNQERFLTVCRAEISGPLPLADKPQTSGATYDPQWKQMSKNWVSANAPPHAVAVTLETAWNTSHSTTEGYRRVGAQLGLAIERYLREEPTK